MASLYNPLASSSKPQRKKILRVGICSRLLILAAIFWLFMQTTLVPSDAKLGRPLSISDPREQPQVQPQVQVQPQAQVQLQRRILYVHIGKTGGEWVKAQLSVICKTRKNPQVKQACLQKFLAQDKDPNSNLPSTQSKLSQQTVGYLHVHSLYPRNAIPLATHYLYSIRHPLTRLISWYIYNHPKSCDPRESNSPSCKTNDWKTQFFDCFPTLEALGSSSSLSSPSEHQCQDVLWNGWRGHVANVKDPNHLYWNYKFYWNVTLAKTPNKGILVVRQESLEQDLTELEAGYLDGGSDQTKKSTTLTPAQKWHKTADSIHFVTRRVSSKLSKSGIQTLCCALQDELILYQTLVQRAENLKDQEKQHTLQSAYETCGVVRDWNELECKQQQQYSY